MLVLWRLFGLLVRERSVLKLVGANLKDGQNVLVGVGRRHRRGRRRWRWRPGRRWGRSWRVFLSSVRVLARARRRWGSAPSGRFHLIGVVLEHGGVGGCWLYWEGST